MSTEVLTALVALGSAWIFDRIKIPAGTLVGTLVGLLISSAVGLRPLVMPAFSAPTVSTAAGIMLAMRFNRHVVRDVAALAVPALFAAGSMVGLGFLLGLIMAHVTGWNAATAMFSVYPGGLEQMVLFAGTLGGNVFAVAMVQLVRWITVVTGYPLLLQNCSATRSKESIATTIELSSQLENSFKKREYEGLDIVSIFLGIIGGIVAWLADLPAGKFVGAFLVVPLFRGRYLKHSVFVPPFVSKVLLCSVGFVMGSDVDVNFFWSNTALFAYATGFTVLLVCGSLLLALLLRRITIWELPLCVIAMAPAGTLEMTLLAEQMGLDPTPVFTLHFSRTVAVIVMGPVLYTLFFN